MRFSSYCITALGFLYLASCQSGGNGGSSGNGSSSTNGTTTNSTIYEVLNSTESSPVQWISQFLQSSPNYESLINLLNQSETNITVFIPSDQVYQAISSFTNSTNNTTNGGGTANGGTNNGNSSNGNSSNGNSSNGNSSNGGSSNGGSSNGGSSNGSSSTNGSENNGASFNMSQYFTSPYIMNFNMTDVIYYHIVNESILIQDLFSNDTMGNATVVNSLVSNDTINRLGYGVQLLLQKIQANQTNGTGTSGDQTNGTEASGGQSSTLVTDGSSNNNTGFNYTIGNGFGYATINTTQMIQTSNGIIYIIDKVLVPPVDFNLTLEALPNITQFSNLTTEQFNVTQFEQLFTTLNATNSSAFETLANMTNSQVDNQTLPNLLAAHIVQGVYYTTNITNATEDITAQSLAGQNITLSKNDTNFFVNNATIVVPNILLDSGVVHLIDTVLNYTSGAGNSTTGSGSGAATSNTMSGASSGPTSSESVSSAAATSSSTESGASSSPSPTTSASTGSGTGNAFPAPTTGPSSDAGMNAPAMYLAAVFAVVAYVF
ncbi:hypothetical protein RMCBS344292_08997 [Rhizopus microsporus]|nr:hypothetical protein RMCBS344292_08997 [Rhizopus microsporus]